MNNYRIMSFVNAYIFIYIGHWVFHRVKYLKPLEAEHGTLSHFIPSKKIQGGSEREK